jgi:flagellar M-ring protein FliF
MAEEKSVIRTGMDMFQKMSTQQKALIGGGVVLGVVLLIVLSVSMGEPDYEPLYTNLDPETAAQIKEQLEERQIPHRLEDEGRTIVAPKEVIYETRIKLAAEGMPSGGTVGYEIFDDQSLGMSDYMMKLNYKRALEGELAETMTQIEGVENARVALVIPERAVFRDEQREPTASVTLTLERGAELSKKHVKAFTHMVASAVEGLEPEKVTIVNDKGLMLTKEEYGDEFGEFTSRQYELKTNVENYLTNRVQDVLTEVLGYGNARALVNVDLDFDSVEKTIKLFDPASQVEISEQTVSTQQQSRNFSDTTYSENENSTANYEVSNTLERIVTKPGNIKRITATAVVNDVTREVVNQNGEVIERIVEPRSQQDLVKLEQVVQNAIGYSEERNDQVSVVSITFEPQVEQRVVEEAPPPKDFLEEWGNPLLMLLAIVAAMFVLRSLLQRLREEKVVEEADEDEYPALEEADEGISFEEGLELEPDDLEKQAMLEVGDLKKEVTDEAVRRKVRQEKITNYVAKNPTEAAKLIGIWLREEE